MNLGRNKKKIKKKRKSADCDFHPAAHKRLTEIALKLTYWKEPRGLFTRQTQWICRHREQQQLVNARNNTITAGLPPSLPGLIQRQHQLCHTRHLLASALRQPAPPSCSRATWAEILGSPFICTPPRPSSSLLPSRSLPGPYWINVKATQAWMTHCSLRCAALIEDYLSVEMAREGGWVGGVGADAEAAVLRPRWRLSLCPVWSI